jgi:hypothetical protein
LAVAARTFRRRYCFVGVRDIRRVTATREALELIAENVAIMDL